jgi:hypothetical protein
MYDLGLRPEEGTLSPIPLEENYDITRVFRTESSIDGETFDYIRPTTIESDETDTEPEDLTLVIGTPVSGNQIDYGAGANYSQASDDAQTIIFTAPLEGINDPPIIDTPTASIEKETKTKTLPANKFLFAALAAGFVMVLFWMK